ncbi:MAG: hypothetical protein AAF735_04255 [Myxococcota bacterium]
MSVDFRPRVVAGSVLAMLTFAFLGAVLINAVGGLAKTYKEAQSYLGIDDGFGGGDGLGFGPAVPSGPTAAVFMGSTSTAVARVPSASRMTAARRKLGYRSS